MQKATEKKKTGHGRIIQQAKDSSQAAAVRQEKNSSALRERAMEHPGGLKEKTEGKPNKKAE